MYRKGLGPSNTSGLDENPDYTCPDQAELPVLMYWHWKRSYDDALTYIFILVLLKALTDAENSYVLNGNRIIDWPGNITVGGATMQYTRSWDHKETLRAMGPTKEDLHLMVFRFFFLFNSKQKVVIAKYRFIFPSSISTINK